MTWDNIKYLFQIPLGWFKAIHDRVFNAYGTNFIVVREDEDGATQITVDDESFTQAVRTIAGGGIDYVKRVVTDVRWDGTTLKYSSENWTFVNGALTGVVSNSDTTIDTPVAY